MFLVERLALGAKASDVANAVRRIRGDERMIVLCVVLLLLSVLNQRLVADVRCVTIACYVCKTMVELWHDVWLLFLSNQIESTEYQLIPP